MSKLLISIVGPTAIGKTKLAVALAQLYNTDILSADSRQFFKEMAIGTAVPEREELKAAKHHFIQHKSVIEPYSVGDFEKDAIRLLDKLFLHHDIVIMVGGSGLYVDAVIKGLDEFPKVAPEIRKQLNHELNENGITALQNKLQQKDPIYYKKVDKDNPHRLIRALEICIGTGKPYSSFLAQPKKERNFTTLNVGLYTERAIIYDSIDRRVDMMIENGLVDEVKSVEQHKDVNALQTVGYKELFGYFEGLWDLETAVKEIKKNTRRFAKRQLTWFKRNADIFWIDAQNEQEYHIQKIQTEVKKLRNE